MRIIAVITFCLALSGAGQSAPSRDDRACAALDSHITAQIEDFAAQQLVSGRDLFLAFLQQMKARELCRKGNAKEAVAIYELIDFPICPDDPCVEQAEG
jgi:hypothetical protein